MFKRFIDILGSLAALILFSPIMAYTAWKVYKTMGSPVLFKQTRPGRGGKPFEIVKFRTMKSANGSDGKPLPDEERITPFGSFMRRTSLDELPEFWNVLKGDMSLVGPRPLLMKYLPYYSVREKRRHSVKPGITGWAQINGRNYAPWDERLEMDVWYVENIGVILDVKIIIATIKKVFTGEGVSVDTKKIMKDLSDERSN